MLVHTRPLRSLWFLAFCLVSPPAFGQTDTGSTEQNFENLADEVERETIQLTSETEADESAENEQWLDAVNALEKAYSVKPHPKYLLEIARIYDEIPDRCQWARLAWDRFIKACDAAPSVYICDEAKEAVRRKVALEAFCPETRSHLAEFEASRQAEAPPGLPWNITSTMGSGVLISEWPVARVVRNIEFAFRYDSASMGMNQPYGIAFEAAYWRATESPNASIVRLGFSGVDDLTVRGGLQALVDPAASVAVYCGVGFRQSLTDYLKLVAEVNLSFWSVSPVILPLEPRLGVSYGF